MAAVSTTERVTTLVAQMGGLAILAGTLAAVTAIVYRWYVRELVPRGLPLLVGLSGVTVYLNTTTVLGQVIAGSTAPTEAEQALFNIAAFLVGAGGTALGRRVGDNFATDIFAGSDFGEIESDVGRLVKSVGRVISVELPEQIDDVTGYDPVPDETKEKLVGKTFLFPRGLTVEELRKRLTQRLKTDYAVGHVDVELAADGTVEYIALGSRAAGIGPTLPPATNAVAIRADPAFAASAGDLVQVWETDPMRRVLTAELRGVAGETVTIAIDAADTPKIDPNEQYRLVTLPVTDRPDREFASLLRAADETFTSVTVEAGSPLHGLPVGGLAITVTAIKDDTGATTAIPPSSYILAPGDTVFAVARPEALRRLERAAEPLDPSLVTRPEPSKHPRDQPQSELTPAQTDTETSAQSAGSEPTSEQDGVDAPDEERPSSTPADETPAQPADGPTATADSGDDGTDDTTSGKAGADSFQELKSAFESGDADWDDEETPSGDETSESEADETTTQTPTESGEDSGETSGKAGADSFQELKSEFESGDADWDDGESGDTDEDDGPEVAFETDDDGSDTTQSDDGDGDVSGLNFDDADNESSDDGLDDLSFEDDGDDLDFDESDDGLGFDDESTDEDGGLAALAGEDDEDDGLELDDEADSGDDEDDDDEEDDDGAEDDDEDDDSGGGGTSFAQLKEEFESGDADWEDDISDSPGGDMRLDE